jgi:plastocyanin
MTLSRSLGVVSLALAAACGGGSSTPPRPGATSLAKTATATGDSQVATAGGVLPSPFRVLVQDQSAAPVSGFAVSWAVGTGGGSITATSTTDANGIAVATRTLGPNAGTQTATASSSGLTGSPVTFRAFSQIQGATTLDPNGGSSQSDTVLSTLAMPFSVIAHDHAGALVAGVMVNWSGTNGATPSQTMVATDATGVSAVTLKLGGTAGSQAAVATVTGLVGSPVSISATALAGNATQMALNGGNNQTGCVNNTLPTGHSVIVRDGHGNPKSAVTVTWVAGDGGGSVSSTSPASGSDGIASVNRTLGPAAGTNADTARVTGLTGSPVVFTSTAIVGATTGSVTVGPGIIYTPTMVTICAGGTVTFTWAAASLPHSVEWTSGPMPRPPDSATMTSGSYPAMFTTPGTYGYICAVHGSAMSGTVVVQ